MSFLRTQHNDSGTLICAIYMFPINDEIREEMLENYFVTPILTALADPEGGQGV